MSKNKFICLDCSSEFWMQAGCLRHRRERTGEPICRDCYKRYSKGGRYGADYYPKEIKDMFSQDIFDYDEIKEFIPKLRTKKKVRFICQECSQEDIMTIASMRRRKICGTKPICRNCALSYATSSSEWVESNSKAQSIAQNRPEVLKKQRDAQLRLMALDPLYAEKRCSKSYISGTIRDFRFDSSWELYFLVHCWNSKDVKSIERYKGSIEYFDSKGIKRRYYPDFVVESSSGKRKVVEIKGSKKYNNFHEKFNAARKMLGLSYIVIEESDLREYGIFFRRESYLKEFYRKNYHEITFYNNERTKSLKERIKEWLK